MNAHVLREPLCHILISALVSQPEADTGEITLVFHADVPEIAAERARRLGLWSKLRSSGVALHRPADLNELRVFYGGRGIWVHQEVTKGLGGHRTGVTVALLHTGSSYADDLSEDGAIYHYPRTKQPGRDLSEVEATKAAMQLRLPVFVVTYPSPSSSKRQVHLGWVQDFDDFERWFLVTFRSEPPAPGAATETDDGAPFSPTATKKRSRRLVKGRPGQPRFKFKVFQRY
jgi:hypothetical protein